jgi:hypothetical protein
MNRPHIRAAAALAAAATLAACAHVDSGGWTTLIDGDRGLENFYRLNDANWRAEGGAIVADKGKGGHLVSKSAYRDFEMRAEFWAASDTNSGIFIRCADPSKVTAKTCYEVNIWDIRPEPKYATAAIVDLAAVPVPIVHKAGGRWNVFEVTAKGDHLVVRFNGVETVNVRDGRLASGYFTLQYGPGVKGAQSGPIKWRKVQIRQL